MRSTSSPTVEPELAEIVDLKFFCGFSFAEIAAMRGVSERTIQRNWEKGRLYLHHAIGERGSDGREAPCRPSALNAGASSARTSTRRWKSPTAERAAWLASIRARDAALAADLQTLLAEHEVASTSRDSSSSAFR